MTEMDESNAAAPEFLRSAEELQAKLTAVGTAEAMGMGREARDLASTFRAWQKVRPANEARIAAIRQLMELNRRAMDFLSQRVKAARK